MNLQYPEGHFIIKPRILPRGARWILGGATKIGKSWILDNIALNVITGTPLWGNRDWECEQGRVLVLEDEVGPYTTGERLRLVMKDVPENLLRDNLFIYSQPEAFSLSDRFCVDWLKAQCEELKPNLIMLDPINKLHYYDDNSAQQMLRLVKVIKEFSGDSAVCIVHHYRKPPSGFFKKDYDPLDPYNFNGSSRLVNDADVFLTLDRKKGRLINHLDGADNWALDARFTFRHGSNPEPFRLKFNEFGDCRVKYGNEELKDAKIESSWRNKKDFKEEGLL